VALLDDRCRTCGADPDMRLVELGVARSRPPPAMGPTSRGPRWRWWATVVAVIAAVWGVLLVTGGAGQDGAVGVADRSTTTVPEPVSTTISRPGSTTSTSEVIAGAPLLGEPSGLRLVWWLGPTGRIVDLDTGAVTALHVEVLGSLQRGLLVEDLGVLEVWPPPYDGSTAITLTDELARFDQVYVVGGGTQVWYLRMTVGPAGPQATTAVLVDQDGRVQAEVAVPGHAWVSGAVAGGLVVSAPGGTFVLSPTGASERVATGNVLATTDDRIYTHRCDDLLECEIEIVDDRGRVLDTRPAQSAPGGGMLPGPDGRIATVVTAVQFGAPSQVFVDGVLVLDRGIDPSSGSRSIAWTPDGRWLVVATGDGVHFIDPSGGRAPILLDIGLTSQQGSIVVVAPGP
jgi:hypothetical protein